MGETHEAQVMAEFIDKWLGNPLARKALKGLTKRCPKDGRRAERALEMYASALMPGRDVEDTVRALRPLVGQPDVIDEIRKRSDAAAENGDPVNGDVIDEEEDTSEFESSTPQGSGANQPSVTVVQIVGLILGSPEFQRR